MAKACAYLWHRCQLLWHWWPLVNSVNCVRKMMILKAKVLGLLWKQDEVKCQQATNKIQ